MLTPKDWTNHVPPVLTLVGVQTFTSCETTERSLAPEKRRKERLLKTKKERKRKLTL